MRTIGHPSLNQFPPGTHASALLAEADDDRNNPDGRHWDAPGRTPIVELLVREGYDVTLARLCRRGDDPLRFRNNHVASPQRIAA